MKERIPSEEECHRILAENKVPENIVRHSEKVKEFALELAGKIGGVNMELVAAGALLHDLDKAETLEGKPYHGELGWEKLREKGFGAVAEICRKHLLEKVAELKTLEEKIVYYADKRIIDERIVTLKERIEFVKEKYGSRDARLREKIGEAAPKALELERELMAMVKK